MLLADCPDLRDIRTFDTYEFPSGGSAAQYSGWIAGGVLALIVLVLAFSSFYTVEANEQAVVLRFGRYHSTALPGAHFKIPLVDQVLKVSIAEQQFRLPGFEGMTDLAATQVPEDQTLMLTGDLNAASVEWTIQWRVKQPKEFLFAF